MIIDCISDLHGFQPKLEGGDLLIIAGDLSARNLSDEYFLFEDWLEKLDYKKIILVAGNHDGFLVKNGPHLFAMADYLCDSGIEFEGLKIWGSPWTPTFMNWHFMKDRGAQIKEKWDLIPLDTDILITHGPPYGILDACERLEYPNEKEHVGCEDLKRTIERIKPKLHVFGHIHEGYGIYKSDNEKYEPTIFVNASIMNERYKPVNKPIRIIL